MKKIIFLLTLSISITSIGQDVDQRIEVGNGSQLKRVQFQDDSLQNWSKEEEIVMILRERALFQEIMLRRQKALIYSLVSISILLVGATVLLVKSSRKKRRINNLLALKSLRTQMNPHFIFNALNSINGFISNKEVVDANSYLTDFAMLMRIVMENLQKDFISLAEEIAALELYLKLEHLRFIDTFDYDLSIDSSIEVDELMVPPMLLQPYIENAIWHGLRHKRDFGHLSVKIMENESSLLLQVTDNGVGRIKSESLKTPNQRQHESTGMYNTERRISMINQMQKHKILVEIKDLEAKDETGTDVLVEIPLSIAKTVSI